MVYSNKFALVTLLSMILAACGGEGSDSKVSTSSPNSNVFNETWFNFSFTPNVPQTSRVAIEEPPYDINRYSGRLDSSNVVLRTNYTNVVGRLYSPEPIEFYILTEKRLLIKPIPAVSEASTGYKDSVLISETGNRVTLAPYNVGLHKDSATYTIEFNKEILDGKLIADVLGVGSFGIDYRSPNLETLIASDLRFPKGSTALSRTIPSNSEDYLDFKYESSYKSIDEWKKAFCNNDTVSGQLLCANLGGVSFKDFVWLGINFTCIDSGFLAGACIVNYNSKLYDGSYYLKRPDDGSTNVEIANRYGGFNKTAADALESALKIHFARRVSASPI
jgi:hypothetical protein